MAEQLQRHSESQDMSGQNSRSQQFRQNNTPEQSYNSEEQRQVYHSTQQSFNEQQDQYREQAFNTYDYQNNGDFSENDSGTGSGQNHFSDNADSSTEKNYESAFDKMSRTQNRQTTKSPPEAADGEESEKVLAPDKKLDKLINKKDAAIGKEEELYHSLKPKKKFRLISTKKYEGAFVSKEEKVQRLLHDRRMKWDAKEVRYSLKVPGTGGRLLLQRTEKRLTKRQNNKRRRKEHRGEYLKDITTRKAVKSAVRTGRLLFDDKTIAEDDDVAETKRYLKKGVRTGRLLVRENVWNISGKTNKYARMQNASDKAKLLDAKINHRVNRLAYRQDKAEAKAALTKAERKKKQQRARQQRKQREGNFIRRTQQNIKLGKKTVKETVKKTKNILSVVFSVGMIIAVFLFAIFFLFIFLMAIFQGSTEAYVQTLVQVDYSVMSDCTAYYRSLEADLEEMLLDTETLEEEIAAEVEEDIYEYVYNLADISFDSTTLVAYLGAKYVEFTLEEVKAELDELFALNYNLVIETKLEEREIDDVIQEVTICYITLEKTPLEEIVIGRMNEDQLYQYNIYKMSVGGQQVYGPVMKTDWTNLITSNFGERIHPITKERTKHNGVDIGIPVGTALYSAVDGTVTLATYSDTAGYYVKIQNSTGWTVIFMHMDSIHVKQGDAVKKGDFVGYSGNTGRSTGPHLHLEVRDAENNPVNPIFIIPQNCAGITSAEE